MKSIQSKILKGRNLKKHIRKLYQERLATDSMFLESGAKEETKVRILSRKSQEQGGSEMTPLSGFLARQKDKFLSQQKAMGFKTESNEGRSSDTLIIKKINRAVEGSRFNIFPRPKYI